MIYKLYHPQAIHELGRRQNQEDAIYPLPDQVNSDHRVFVVCDGMGGLDKGEVASEAVCKTLGRVAETILHTLGAFTDDDLAHCMNAAYEALDAADTDNEADDLSLFPRAGLSGGSYWRQPHLPPAPFVGSAAWRVVPFSRPLTSASAL